jgi:hypothetical protein
MTWWGLHLYRTSGLDPVDGGTPAPYPIRLLILLVLVTVGWSTAIALLRYARRYVLSVSIDESGRTVRLRTLTYILPTTLEIPVGDIRSSYVSTGVAIRGGKFSNYEVTVAGRGTFVLDRRWARIDDPDALHEVLKLGRQLTAAPPTSNRRVRSGSSGPRRIYVAGRRAGFVAVVAAAATAVVVITTVRTLVDYGMPPTPPTSSEAEATGWLMVRLFLGFASFAALRALGQHYLTAVHVDDQGRTVSLQTLWPGTRVVPAADVLSPRTAGPAAGAPRSRPTTFATVRIAGQRLPYLLDLHGTIERPDALRRYLRVG